MERGWVKCYRKEVDWEWFREPNTAHLFHYMVLAANRYDGKWQGVNVPAGCFISSIRTLSEKTGLTVSQVRTAIKHLISTHDITQSSTSKYTLYKVENYFKYQDRNTLDNTLMTQSSHSDDTVMTHNKKERKKERKNERRGEGPKRPYGPHQNVFLSEWEFENLKQKFPEMYLEKIDKLSTYMWTNEKNYPDHYRTLTSWITEDMNNPRYVSSRSGNGQVSGTDKSCVSSHLGSGQARNELPDWYKTSGQNQEVNWDLRKSLIRKQKEAQQLETSRQASKDKNQHD